MKNTLADLNNYLFETLERLTDDDLTEEDMQREIVRSEAITKVAQTVIQNGELTLKAMKHVEEYGRDEKTLPPMLTAGDK